MLDQPSRDQKALFHSAWCNFEIISLHQIDINALLGVQQVTLFIYEYAVVLKAGDNFDLLTIVSSNLSVV